MNNYNYVPVTIDGNQFLAYKQSGAYMTDYRPSSDMYAYLVNNSGSTGQPITSSHKLRAVLQANGESMINQFMSTTRSQFLNMQVPGASNTCSGARETIIYNGGAQLKNTNNELQLFPRDCGISGGECIADWYNTPLPQQGQFCSK